jgi:hypothetical protein
VTMVLLKVAVTYAIPRVTFLRTFPVFFAIEAPFQFHALPSPC